MTKTEKYKLNQWVPEDPVRREDFNQDNRNIENALVAHDEAVSAALKEHEQTVAAQLAAVEEENCLYRLGQTARFTEAQRVSFDLSGVDMSRYAALLLLVSTSGDGDQKLIVNDGTPLNMMNMYRTVGACAAFLMPYTDTTSLLMPVGSTSGSTYTLRVSGGWTKIVKLTPDFPVNMAALYGIKA